MVTFTVVPTSVIAEGYDDADSATLPVIVDYAGTPKKDVLADRAEALPAVRVLLVFMYSAARRLSPDPPRARDPVLWTISGRVRPWTRSTVRRCSTRSSPLSLREHLDNSERVHG
ncbi:hypothetical protein ACFCX0_01910 [Streptomyces sp. NPDC056352]|uniref:hypothetical protein n=1 Tax=Streptomyces sp. NPDC056352 TaxID=3345791 RepID=UPI0035E32865